MIRMEYEKSAQIKFDKIDTHTQKKAEAIRMNKNYFFP